MQGVAAAAVVLFSANLAEYAFSVAGVPIPPVVPAVVLGTAALALGGIGRLHSLATVWAGMYLLLSGLAFLYATNGEAFGILERRVLSMAFLMAMFVLLKQDAARRAAMTTAAAVALFGVALNIYEWFTPLTFSFSYGRSAGLYVNPNISGAALVTAMVLGITAVPPRLRETFALVVGLGVLLTFSRGALIGWTCATAVLMWSASIGARRLILSVAASVVIVGGAAAVLTDLPAAVTTFVESNPEIAGRLVGRQSADANGDARRDVAAYAWTVFASNPVIGTGLGATSEWNAEETHNTYLMHLAEQGAFGFLLLPGLILVMWRTGLASAERGTVCALAGFAAVWGIFSHNTLDDFHLLVAFGWALSASPLVRTARMPISTPFLARLRLESGRA